MSYFSTNERKGVLGLVLLIVCLQLFDHYFDFTSANDTFVITQSPEIMAFQKEIDSLKHIEIEARKPKIYPFNPSFLTDYRAYKLGMQTAEIDRLLAHRKAGKYINSTKEFQEVSQINDSLLDVLQPYFKFPDWVIAKQNRKFQSKKTFFDDKIVRQEDRTNSEFEKQDLNTVTAEELQKVNGIGVKLAARIIKYREVLKGYSFNYQLYEVWYLDREVADRVLQRFRIITKPTIEKINLNTASFKEILHLPYIDYELTKEIFGYRDEMAEIQSLEELKNIDSFPMDKFDRISLYLKVE